MKKHKNVLNVRSYNRKELESYVGAIVTISAHVSNEYNTSKWRLLKSCYIKDFNINIDHLWVSSEPLKELDEGPYTLKAKITKYRNKNKYGIEVIRPTLRKKEFKEPKINADSKLAQQIDIITENAISLVKNSPEAYLLNNQTNYNVLKQSSHMFALLNPEVDSNPVTIVKRFAYEYKEIWTKFDEPQINELLQIYHLTSGTFVGSLPIQADLQNIELQEIIWKYDVARNSISANNHPVDSFTICLNLLENMNQENLLILVLTYLIKSEIAILTNHKQIVTKETINLVSRMKSLLGL